MIAAVERNGDDGKAGNPEYQTSFYMKQTDHLDNACGIIACIHSVLNSTGQIPLSEDSLLGKFNEDTRAMTPSERATYLENYTAF